MNTHYPRAGGGAGGHGAEGASKTEDKAAKASQAAFKAGRKVHRELGLNIFWWIVTGIVVVIGLLHAISLIRAWMIRRRVARRLANERTSAGSSPTYFEKEKRSPFTIAPGTKVHRAEPGLLTTLHAGRALFNSYAYVRVFPLWIFSHTTAAEMWWTAAYTGTTLGLAFWVSRYNGIMDIPNPMGYVVST